MCSAWNAHNELYICVVKFKCHLEPQIRISYTNGRQGTKRSGHRCNLTEFFWVSIVCWARTVFSARFPLQNTSLFIIVIETSVYRTLSCIILRGEWYILHFVDCLITYKFHSNIKQLSQSNMTYIYPPHVYDSMYVWIWSPNVKCAVLTVNKAAIYL